MQLTRVQEHILFTLGHWYAEARLKLPAELELSLSKKAFIESLLAASIAGKKERALYRNLEDLEQRKLLAYRNRALSLTPAGQRVYESISRKLAPFLGVVDALRQKDPLRYSKKIQTAFSGTFK